MSGKEQAAGVGRVETGSPIRAGQFNRLASRVDAVTGGGGGHGVSMSGANGAPTPSLTPSGQWSLTGPIMLGINTSATAIKTWQPVAITGLVRAAPYRDRSLTLRIEGVTTSGQEARIGIAQDPIRASGSGRVFVPGATLVRASGTGTWASVALSSDAMTLGTSGTYPVLWSDSTAGLALILIGSGGSTENTGPTWRVWDER